MLVLDKKQSDGANSLPFWPYVETTNSEAWAE